MALIKKLFSKQARTETLLDIEIYKNKETNDLEYRDTNNKIVKVAWDKFDLFDRNVAIWLQNKHNSAPDINFHQEIIDLLILRVLY